MKKIYILFMMLTMVSPSLWADDSVEGAATGNVVFEKAPELVMQDEVLTITKSASQKLGDEQFSIDVDFHFKNISDHDVTRKIAFVMPPVYCRMEYNTLWRGLDVQEDSPLQKNGLKDFSTTVNGQAQVMTLRTEAKMGSKDITNNLITHGVPLNPCKVQDQGVDKVPYANFLKSEHLISEAGDPAWSENLYYEWTQTFPAGQVINIHHHYTPVMGASVVSPRTEAEINSEFNDRSPPLTPIWNMDVSSLAAFKPSVIYDKHDLDVGPPAIRYCVMPEWVEYNLLSGANWNGGIGHFTLVIHDEAGTPYAVNQFYTKADAAEVTREDNGMTIRIKNFVPSSNLIFLFVSLPKDIEDLQLCGM